MPRTDAPHPSAAPTRSLYVSYADIREYVNKHSYNNISTDIRDFMARTGEEEVAASGTIGTTNGAANGANGANAKGATGAKGANGSSGSHGSNGANAAAASEPESWWESLLRCASPRRVPKALNVSGGGAASLL